MTNSYFVLGFQLYCTHQRVNVAPVTIRCVSVSIEIAPNETANRKYAQWKHTKKKSPMYCKKVYTLASGGILAGSKRAYFVKLR